jgi:hypothetical protein
MPSNIRLIALITDALNRSLRFVLNAQRTPNPAETLTLIKPASSFSGTSAAAHLPKLRRKATHTHVRRMSKAPKLVCNKFWVLTSSADGWDGLLGSEHAIDSSRAFPLLGSYNPVHSHTIYINIKRGFQRCHNNVTGMRTTLI